MTKPRRVRALRKVYVNHVLYSEGAEFVYSGPPAAHLFLELEQGDTSPGSVDVPRREEAESTVASASDDDVL
jgi:hypothetical protein